MSADPPQVPVVPALARRHLLAVWNPVLGADAMEQHPDHGLGIETEKARHGEGLKTALHLADRVGDFRYE